MPLKTHYGGKNRSTQGKGLLHRYQNLISWFLDHATPHLSKNHQNPFITFWYVSFTTTDYTDIHLHRQETDRQKDTERHTQAPEVFNQARTCQLIQESTEQVVNYFSGFEAAFVCIPSGLNHVSWSPTWTVNITYRLAPLHHNQSPQLNLITHQSYTTASRHCAVSDHCLINYAQITKAQCVLHHISFTQNRNAQLSQGLPT